MLMQDTQHFCTGKRYRGVKPHLFAGCLTLLREYLRQGLIWRSVLSSRSSVSCWKVLTGLSMSLEAAKSRPKPTLPMTSKLSLCTYADL